jgi:adenosylcobinamide kinase/adenosylcobinamide-phosphate guanylyltransferase
LKRLFVATARFTDKEMAARIRRHQEARGEGWSTVEAPLEVVGPMREHAIKNDVVLLDCVTIWVSNLLMDGSSDAKILESADRLANVLLDAPCSVALVTNEVGSGIVPEHPLGRRFRDLAGFVNQRLATAVDHVMLMVAGIALQAK